MHPRDHDEIDWAIVDRYLAGECRPEEATEMRRWLAVQPGLRELVERAPIVVANETRATGSPGAAEWDVERALARFATPSASVTTRQTIPHSRTAKSHAAWWTTLRMPLFAVAASVAILTVSLMFHGRSVLASSERQYATAAGQRLTVTLVDGTRFTLAPGSRLRLPASYGRDTRDVELEGEAYFTVVHDAARPFAVHTPTAVVRDIGTVFDVYAYPEDAATRIAVTEGTVAIASPSQPTGRNIVMHGGDVAIVDGSGVRRTVMASTESLTAWTTGELVFDNAPVAEVARAMSRWYDLDITVNSAALQQQHLSATYTHVSADIAIELVARALNAQVERHGRTIVLQ